MSASPPLVWVVVLNWNGCQDTLRCLASLEAQDYSPLRILVVDNGSTDQSAQILAETLPDRGLLLLPSNLGFAGGMNRGMAAAFAGEADFVLLLNNDAELAPDAVRRLVAATQEEPQAALAVPSIRHQGHPDAWWYAGGSLSRWTGTVRHWPEPPGQEPRWVSFGSGCCLMVSRKTYQEIGGLNEDYFLYFEDVEYCERVLSAGRGILYVPAAVAWHAGGASTESQQMKAPALDYYDLRNGLAYIRQHLHGMHGWSALAFLFAVRVPRKVLRILLRSIDRQAGLRAVLQGLQDGLRGRMGPYAARPAGSSAPFR